MITKSYTTGEQVIDLEKGKEATTILELIEHNTTLNRSLLKCTPITGRTHQIRVHCKELGHSIVNDPIYNEDIKKNKSQTPKIVEKCPECKGNIDYYHNYDNDIQMHLHAYQYSHESNEHKGFLFRSKIPKWAAENYTREKLEAALILNK